MRKFIKLVFLTMTVAFMFTACNSNEKANTDTDVDKSSVSTVESTVEVTKNADELRNEIVGQWGRLDEVMNYFLEDKRCVIGGMQGTYDIDDENNLVLTTMSGSITTYDWASSRGQITAENYWYLDGDTLKINGNEFTKIYGKETPDYIE